MGYNAWRKTKQYPHARLLYIHPLSEGQVAGRFDQQLMKEIIALVADVNSNSSSGRRVKLNAIQIRVAISAVRVGQDKVRSMARHMRRSIADPTGFRCGQAAPRLGKAKGQTYDQNAGTSYEARQSGIAGKSRGRKPRKRTAGNAHITNAPLTIPRRKRW